MNDKLKDEMENFFHSFNTEKLVMGDSRLNAYVDTKFIFPYNYLDHIRTMIDNEIKNYAIYFIMSCDRKEIKSYEVCHKYINIRYENGKGFIETVRLDLIHCFNLNNYILEMILPFLQYEICKCGSTFKIYISSENMLQLKQKKPEIFNLFSQVYMERNCFFIELDIYRLIWRNNVNKNIVEEFNLLYIGKSNANKSDFDILNRLNSHETIQHITRDNNLYYRTKELMVMIFSFKSKFFREENLNSLFLDIILGDSNWEEERLLTNISENQELILLIEAILINHFKPKYNQQYAKKISIKSKIYEEFNRQKVDPVSVELDLSMDWGKIQLRTKVTKTETKMRILECCIKNNTIIVEYDDLPDSIYDIC